MKRGGTCDSQLSSAPREASIDSLHEVSILTKIPPSDCRGLATTWNRRDSRCCTPPTFSPINTAVTKTPTAAAITRSFLLLETLGAVGGTTNWTLK